MELFYIYNNLKVHPFKPLSAPAILGFEVLIWEATTTGTLFDIGGNAGLITEGSYDIHGQVWKPENYDYYDFLVSFCGVDEDLTEIKKIKVKAIIDQHKKEDLEVFTFSLKQVKSNYNIIKTGKWLF